MDREPPSSSEDSFDSEVPATIPFQGRAGQGQERESDDSPIPSKYVMLTYETKEFERTLRVLGYSYDAEWDSDLNDEGMKFHCCVVEAPGEHRTVHDWWLVMKADEESGLVELLRVVLFRSPHHPGESGCEDVSVARGFHNRLVARLTHRLTQHQTDIENIRVDAPIFLQKINGHIANVTSTMNDGLQ